jgi:hypothetical protein
VLIIAGERQILIERIRSWQRLRHPHVLPVFGLSPDAAPPLMISQYYPHGNAIDFLNSRPAADRAEIVSAVASLTSFRSLISLQMFTCALGMRYLHEVSSLSLLFLCLLTSFILRMASYTVALSRPTFSSQRMGKPALPITA